MKVFEKTKKKHDLIPLDYLRSFLHD